MSAGVHYPTQAMKELNELQRLAAQGGLKERERE